MDGDTEHRAPRWVKAFWLAVLAAALAVALLHLTGNGLGGHGP